MSTSKLTRLLDRIQSTKNPVVDLNDYALDLTELQAVVDKLNGNSLIHTLILKHNCLNDESAATLAELQHIQVLDLSYNDFTLPGLELIQAGLNSRHPAEYSMYFEHNYIQSQSPPTMFSKRRSLA